MIYFLSDAHLGSRVMTDPQEHQQKLVRLLLHMSQDAQEIYLLGDIFDYWYELVWKSSRESKRAQYGPILDCLRQLTQQGIQVHFFIGNHDIWTFGWLSRETGVTVHRKPEVRTLYGKRVYMGHGDGLAPSDVMQRVPKDFRRRIRRFMLLRWIFHCLPIQYLCRLMPTQAWDEMGYNWAKNSRLKELAHPCSYKGENQEELVLFAKEQESKGKQNDYYIFGHRHIELDLMIKTGARVLILGDFFQQWTYAQMNEQGEILLMNSDY